jgi:hypothetical protein
MENNQKAVERAANRMFQMIKMLSFALLVMAIAHFIKG